MNVTFRFKYLFTKNPIIKKGIPNTTPIQHIIKWSKIIEPSLVASFILIVVHRAATIRGRVFRRVEHVKHESKRLSIL